MPVVEFLKLDKAEKAKHLCLLADEFYAQGKRVLIVVADENMALTLDKYMWTWNKGSFLPHGWDNGTVECFDEAITICAEERNANSATVLIAAAPCSMQFMVKFDHIVDFAETYDEQLRLAARQRYAAWQGGQCDLRMR